jgi:hypothetical protein
VATVRIRSYRSGDAAATLRIVEREREVVTRDGVELARFRMSRRL